MLSIKTNEVTAMPKKREYMMAPFRDNGLDDDIRDKYFAIPEGKRSDALRDAFRLWCGIDKKLVFEAKEQPIGRPSRPLVQKGGKPHGSGVHGSRPWRG